MNDIRQWLLTEAEADYARFSASLLPGVEHILGVRLPKLRKMANDIAKTDWQQYLQNGEEFYFEDIMLKGMVIGAAKMSWPEAMGWIEQFVPKITNWSVCDSFCSGLKKKAKIYRAEMWQFIQPYLAAENPYAQRFAIVMMLGHYLDDVYLAEVLERLSGIETNHYYVQMAMAWAISMCYVRNPALVLPYLQDSPWDEVILNKALQKIIESRQITNEQRQQMRDLKRPKK